MLITLLFLINLVRDVPLQESAVLNQRAEIRAEQLCEDRIKYNIDISHRNWEDSFAGLKKDYWGENLSWDFANDLDAFIALMRSPSHRFNILNKNYSEIGIGYSKKCNLKVELFRGL